MAKSLSQLSADLSKAERDLDHAWATIVDPARCLLRPDSISAEEHDRLCHARFVAERNYQVAVWKRAFAKREQFRNRKATPRACDAIKLRDQKYAAQVRFDELNDLGPEFYKKAEWHDARAAAWLAEELYDIAEAKFQEGQRQ